MAGYLLPFHLKATIQCALFFLVKQDTSLLKTLTKD